MNEDTRWVVNAFLADQDRIDPGKLDTTPMHVVGYRLALIEMVLTEVEDDDLECMAIRALGDSTRDLYLTPAYSQARLDALKAWVAAKRAYLEVIKAAYGASE
jgi:hypothetical protein